eukprot:1455973-Amphidinium_carterae.1
MNNTSGSSSSSYVGCCHYCCCLPQLSTNCFQDVSAALVMQRQTIERDEDGTTMRQKYEQPGVEHDRKRRRWDSNETRR